MSRLFYAALFVAAILLVGRALAPQTIGETVRRKLLTQLQTHYQDHYVSISRGHFDPDRGVTLEGIKVEAYPMRRGESRRELIHIDRLTVEGIFDVQRLLDQRNPIVTRRVLLWGVEANLWMQADGSFSIESLLPLPQFGPAAPSMDLHEVTLRLHGDQPATRPVELDIAKIQVQSKQSTLGHANKRIVFDGSGDLADQFGGIVNLTDGAIDVRAAAQNIRLSRSLFERLPNVLAQKLKPARDLSCVLDGDLAYYQSAEGKVDYKSKLNIHDGQYSSDALPYPVSGLRGKLTLDPSGVTIEASQAEVGDAILRAGGRVDGYSYPCDASLHVVTRGLMLDERIAAGLPETMRAGWDKVRAVGRVDIDADVVCQAGKWTSDATLTCKGLDVRYEKFPYPIEQIVGRIEVHGNRMTADSLSGRIGSNRMQCAFRVPINKALSRETSFVVATDGPLPIDQTLLRALSPRGSQELSGLEKFVRSLHPAGQVQLTSAKFSTSEDGKKSKRIDLNVIGGRLQYDKFPYPLYNVTGRVEVADRFVQLRGFQATNANAGIIQCDGYYRLPAADSQATMEDLSQLALDFRASNVPMDESLRQSLPDSTKQVWDVISPGGLLDELQVKLTRTGNVDPLSLDVTAEQRDHMVATNRILSLRPSSLPYRLDITGGTVRFDGSRVWIDSIHGSHDASKVSANGMCVQNRDGRWMLTLDLQAGSRLHPDPELIASLPTQMREAMRRLQLRGPVSVRGRTELALPDQLHVQTDIDWDLILQLEGNRIGDVGPVHSLRGELLVKGRSDARALVADGSINLDSMHVEDLQLTNIRGPFSIVNDQMTLGNNQSQETISGRLFDGEVDLDGKLVLSSGAFDVGLVVSDAQVPIALAEYGYGGQALTGSCTGQVQLQGNLGSLDLLKGSGAARVSGANLYELPFIYQIFNLLRINPSEDYAFTDGEVEFNLISDTVTFSEMQIWGDLISLQGGGTLDRRRDLNLTFNTRVSPKNTFTQIVRPLRSPKYTLWTIDVTGPVDSPNIQRRALDGVSETLGRWFPGMARTEKSGEEKSEGKSTTQKTWR